MSASSSGSEVGMQTEGEGSIKGLSAVRSGSGFGRPAMRSWLISGRLGLKTGPGLVSFSSAIHG
ncbi:unnamed protein product [Rhodiola kirilowii]